MHKKRVYENKVGALSIDYLTTHSTHNLFVMGKCIWNSLLLPMWFQKYSTYWCNIGCWRISAHQESRLQGSRCSLCQQSQGCEHPSGLQSVQKYTFLEWQELKKTWIFWHVLRIIRAIFANSPVSHTKFQNKYRSWLTTKRTWLIVYFLVTHESSFRPKNNF